jgi:hypothetical protein
MSDIAEQNEELEVLASIYPEEFKMLDGERSFKILLKPNPDGDDNHGTSKSKYWLIILLYLTILSPSCLNSDCIARL